MSQLNTVLEADTSALTTKRQTWFPTAPRTGNSVHVRV